MQTEFSDEFFAGVLRVKANFFIFLRPVIHLQHWLLPVTMKTKTSRILTSK